MKYAIFASLLLTATPALAQQASVGVGVSSMGATVEGSYGISDNFSVRGVYAGGISFDGDLEFDSDDETYDVAADGQLGGVALFADFYPRGEGFRVSGGLFFSNTELTGEFVGPTETFDGEATFKDDVAVLLAGGYDFSFANGWGASFEAGAIFNQLEVSSDSTDADVQADIEEINDDLEELPIYPWVAATVTFSF